MDYIELDSGAMGDWGDWDDPVVNSAMTGPSAIESLLFAADPSVALATVRVEPWARAITNNLVDAIVLSQVAYWMFATSPRGKRMSLKASPGRGLYVRHTARSEADFTAATGLTPDAVTHSLRRLKAAGLLNWKTKLFGGLAKRHIWLKTPVEQARAQPTPGRAIAVRPWLVRHLNARLGKEEVQGAIGGTAKKNSGVSGEAAAFVASQLLFWFTRTKADGLSNLWRPDPARGLDEPSLPMRNTSLAEQTGLSTHRVNRSMAVLKRLGMVKTQYTMWGGKRTALVMLPLAGWSEAVGVGDPSGKNTLVGTSACAGPVQAPAPDRCERPRQTHIETT